MHERDLSGQTRTRARVDQLDMHLLERRQRLDDVRRVEAEVVQPLAATLQEAPHTRRRIERLEQLDLGLTGAQQRGAYVLVRDRRLLEQGQSQRVTVEPVCVREPIHDDADVVDSSHHAQSPSAYEGAPHETFSGTMKMPAGGARTRAAGGVTLERDHWITLPEPLCLGNVLRDWLAAGRTEEPLELPPR